ncbi:hypothetical protein BDZ89DRAFT_1139729 [Hymenopellis radicata]|nr:hypothetical protein BDZ89DRAFT_1139729 [Hymenopellis radicata]
MVGPPKATAGSLQEQREFELATVGYSDIPSTRPRGRPGQSSYHAHYSLADGIYETEQRDHVVQAGVHGSLESHPLPTAKRPKIRPSDLDDDFATMDFHVGHQFPAHDAPLDEVDVLERQRDGDTDDEDDDEEDFEEEVQGDTGKRKRSKTSDNPMGEWKPWLHVFLEETLRRHGLGNATLDPKCLERHAWSPLHVMQVWRDECWERTTLFEMGLVYQIGHQGGRCVYPEPTHRLMTVIHINSIHTVKYQYCSCDVSDYEHKWQQLLRNGWYPASMLYPATCVTMDILDHYRRLQVIATVNVRDFVTVLEKTTDPYGTEHTPDRYKVFKRVQRQWKFLKRVRRSGVAHDPGGLLEAKPASLVVECWACPRIGVNLPADWESVDEKYQYRYRRMFSVDANFRMNCKMRPEPRPDLPLYDGLGVQMPTEMYHAWLLQYITEEDISSCIAFAALMQKDTRFSVGLRWSGVLGVICARHEIILGLGDLQKGERYKNTDFVLYTVLSRMGLKELTVTYDIACQYKIHFYERIKALPAALHDLMLEAPVIQWALPVWHGNVHEVKCEAAESLKYKVGVGKTDGEGIERVWAVLNPFAYMTKEELPGARHDNIEDKLN